jgi:hypothetical protein
MARPISVEIRVTVHCMCRRATRTYAMRLAAEPPRRFELIRSDIRLAQSCPILSTWPLFRLDTVRRLELDNQLEAHRDRPPTTCATINRTRSTNIRRRKKAQTQRDTQKWSLASAHRKTGNMSLRSSRGLFAVQQSLQRLPGKYVVANRSASELPRRPQGPRVKLTNELRSLQFNSAATRTAQLASYTCLHRLTGGSTEALGC